MAPPSRKSPRPGGSASRPAGLTARQGGTTSRPGRYLAALAVLVFVMLGSVIGTKHIAHPGQWHSAFKVALGLDLSSGVTVTVHAVAPNNKPPTKAAMDQAVSILLSRVNGQGFTGATVVPMGTSDITISIPHTSAEAVSPLLASAVLRFRQVLLLAPGYPVATTVPTPTTSPSPGASPSPTPKASSSAHASSSPTAQAGAKPSPSPTPAGAKATASPKPSASGQAAVRSSGRGLTVGSRAMPQAGRAAAQPASSASPKPSSSPATSPSPSASASPSPTPSAAPSEVIKLPTAADAAGNAALVKSPAVIADFNKLNCRNKHWQAEIYGSNPNHWDNPNVQIVACDTQGNKYVLDVAKVLGNGLTTINAALNSTNQWVVDFNLKSGPAQAFGTLTTMMYDKYFDVTTGQATSVLDQFAIVLDGDVVSAPQISQAITQGQGEITGPAPTGFSQSTANKLANVLKYGAVPLAFVPQSTESISAQLGSSQLTAGLIAAGIGLLLVVLYSFLYYRGLGLVSVSSLAIAALLTWLAVILLSTYENFTLSLAGVAGLIVAIGITADSFVVYFERLRDEVREGRSLRAAVERGWQRARRTILVSDTVSFLAAALLYIFSIGDVRGFAFTLGLTTMIDIVVVFLFTKPMVTLLARTKFYGQGHKLSGLDPARLGAKSPWRGSRSGQVRPAVGGVTATSAVAARTTPKEA